MKPGAPFSGGFGKMRADAKPFLIGQIRGVSLALHSAERRQPSCTPRSFQTVSGETVWKIAEGLSRVLHRRLEATDRAPLSPLECLRNPYLGMHPDFPNSFGRVILRSSQARSSRKFAIRSSHLAYVSCLGSLLECPRSMQRERGGVLACPPPATGREK